MLQEKSGAPSISKEELARSIEQQQKVFKFLRRERDMALGNALKYQAESQQFETQKKSLEIKLKIAENGLKEELRQNESSSGRVTEMFEETFQALRDELTISDLALNSLKKSHEILKVQSEPQIELAFEKNNAEVRSRIDSLVANISKNKLETIDQLERQYNEVNTTLMTKEIVQKQNFLFDHLNMKLKLLKIKNLEVLQESEETLRTQVEQHETKEEDFWNKLKQGVKERETLEEKITFQTREMENMKQKNDQLKATNLKMEEQIKKKNVLLASAKTSAVCKDITDGRNKLADSQISSRNYIETRVSKPEWSNGNYPMVQSRVSAPVHVPRNWSYSVGPFYPRGTFTRRPNRGFGRGAPY